jgi:hypothetical protein
MHAGTELTGAFYAESIVIGVARAGDGEAIGLGTPRPISSAPGLPQNAGKRTCGYAPDKSTCLAATLEIGNIYGQRKSAAA